MADKRVQIGCGDLNLSVLRTTKATITEEIDSDIVKTFDEPVSVPSTDGGFTVDLSILEARNLNDFITLKKILKRMKTETGTLSIFETIKHKEGNFETENHFGGVSVSSNKVEFSADSLTARDISFKCETKREIVNNEEI